MRWHYETFMRSRLSRRKLLQTLGVTLGASLSGCSESLQQPSPRIQTKTPASETKSSTTPPRSTIETPRATGETIKIFSGYCSRGWPAIWNETLIPLFEDLDLDVEVTHGCTSAAYPRRTIRTLIENGELESFDGDIGFAGAGDIANEHFARGNLSPVTSTTDALTDANGDLVGEPATVFGENYVLPHGKFADTIHYRADVFDRFGLEPPTTIERLRHAASVIDDSDEERRNGFALSAAKTGQSEAWFKVFLNAFGSHFWRWANENHREAEVWFPEEEVRSTLELAADLARDIPEWHSDSPEDINWSGSAQLWAEDGGGDDPRFAMMYNLTTWGAGFAARAGKPDLVRNTDILPIPTTEDGDAFARGQLGFDGFLAVSNGDNLPGLRTALEAMYRDPERAAQYYSPVPTEILPAYAAVMETDAYASIDVFEEYPRLLELNRRARDEIVPLEPSSEQMVMTPATVYAESFNITGELMYHVVVKDRSIAPAIQDARERLERRLQEGQRLAEKHFNHASKHE